MQSTIICDLIILRAFTLTSISTTICKEMFSLTQKQSNNLKDQNSYCLKYDLIQICLLNITNNDAVCLLVKKLIRLYLELHQIKGILQN